MTAKEDLFILIKSLSKTEKAYFKKYASIHSSEGKQQYLMLFDLLNEMSVYNESELKKKLQPSGIKQLSVYKNYLYRIILRSQAQYARTHTNNHYLDELLLEIEVLMAKNLFSQCISLIQKAKNIARENENFTSLLKLLQFEIRFIKQSPSVKNWKEMYESVVNEETDALRKLNDIVITRNMNADMFLFLQSHATLKDDEIVKKQQTVLYERLISYPMTHSSAECAINHLSAFVNYYKFTQEPEKAYPYQFQAIEIFEQKPFLIVNEPLRYVNSLSNLLILEMMQGDSEAFMTTLQKLKTVETFVPKPLFSPNLQLHIFALGLRHELSFYVRFEQYEQGVIAIEQHKKALLENSELMNEIFFFQIAYYQARIYFGLNQVSEVNYWLQFILQSAINSYNKAYHFWAKMLHFLVYWQDESHEFVKSLAKSIINFSQKYKLEMKSELYLVRRLLEINKLLNQRNREEAKNVGENLSVYLAQNKPQESYFDYLKWWEKQKESLFVSSTI
ncbi:MAG: hypothetical protein ACKVTZ_22625 [Bacteroidia bacterium]